MRNDFQRLFDHLEAISIGFGPAFKDFQIQAPNYPPHNIITLSETEFKIELAVAGFKKNEIRMEEHQGVLTVRGDKESSDLSYQYRGIAARSFSKSFRVAEYFEVSGASLEDGILTVTFTKNVPDEARPKLIAIK
jgi:molecular chaperone IbpA